jgi:hypothetical protein
MKGNNIGITAIDEFKVTVGGNTFTMTQEETILNTPSSIGIKSISKSVDISSKSINILASETTTVSGGGGTIVEENGFVDIN